MVTICSVEKDSVCGRARVLPGDVLDAVNGHEIRDFLDYRFYLAEKELTLRLLRGGVPYEIKVKKNPYDDIGLSFESYLMDEQKSCRNKCIFCFIDQNPKGMRESIYFKDDDSRLSFFFGNYITLTNLTPRDIRRILEMRLSPVNISVHTTNPDLRVMMMQNKKAGESLSVLRQFYDGGILMNAQVVLCRGINDGAELTRTLDDLSSFYPYIGSVAVVPSGLTKHRDCLYPLESFDETSSREVISIIDQKAKENLKKHGQRLVYPSDEWFIKAGIPIPKEDYYEGYPQLENGVGMLRSMQTEIDGEISRLRRQKIALPANRNVSVVTGEAAYAFIREAADQLERQWNLLSVNVYSAKNHFFGGNVTVAGLLTGGDLYAALRGKELFSELFLPSSMLRHEGDLFLDDMSVSELEEKLRVTITPVPNNGVEFVRKLLGITA